MTKKLGSGHVGEEYASPLSHDYAERMAMAQKEIPREKKAATTEQCASTMRNLELQKTRHYSQDKEWQLRPIPESYLAVPDAKDHDQLVAKRSLDHEQVSHVQSIRHGGTVNTLGDGFKASTSPERRDKAIHGFTYSKPYRPTDEEIKTLIKSVELTCAAPQPMKPIQEKKEGWLSKFIVWFQGFLGDGT